MFSGEVHSDLTSFAITLLRKRELVGLIFLTVSCVGLWYHAYGCLLLHNEVLGDNMLVLDDNMLQVPDEIKSSVVNVQCVWEPWRILNRKYLRISSDKACHFPI